MSDVGEPTPMKREQDREAEIRERLDAATAGPWQECGCGKCAHVWSIADDVMVATGIGAEDYNYTGGEGPNHEQRERNAEFIAHSREDVAWLLSELARLRTEAHQMQGWKDLAMHARHSLRCRDRFPDTCQCGFTQDALAVGMNEKLLPVAGAVGPAGHGGES